MAEWLWGFLSRIHSINTCHHKKGSATVTVPPIVTTVTTRATVATAIPVVQTTITVVTIAHGGMEG